MVEGVSCHEHNKTSFPRIIYLSTVESMNKGLFYKRFICCQQIILVQIDEIYLYTFLFFSHYYHIYVLNCCKNEIGEITAIVTGDFLS